MDNQFASTTTADDRTWGMLTHIISIVSTFFGPLLVYLIKKDTSRFVSFHALQCCIFNVFCYVLIIPISLLTCGFGAILVMVPMIFHVVGAIKANSGEWYELPIAGGMARKSVFGG